MVQTKAKQLPDISTSIIIIFRMHTHTNTVFYSLQRTCFAYTFAVVVLIVAFFLTNLLAVPFLHFASNYSLRSTHNSERESERVREYSSVSNVYAMYTLCRPIKHKPY